MDNFLWNKATDIVDGDVTKNIKVDSSEVNLNKVGTYPIYFTVTDALGNEASKSKSTVQIVDTSSPALTIDKLEISYPTGKTVSDKQFLQDIGTKVTNSYGTVKVTTNLSKIVDWDKAGQYKVTVTATNSSGGVAEKTILLTVKNTDASFIAIPSKNDNNNKPAKNIPKTGDTLNTELIVFSVMSLLVGGWLFLRRKTKVKTK